MKISISDYKYGYTPITKMDALSWDDPKNSRMDFGILKLKPNENYEISDAMEKAVLLMNGQVKIKWGKPPKEMQEQTIERKSLFDESPWCLHVPKSVKIQIQALGNNTELNIIKTKNEKEFPAKLYLPKETPDENRGKGTMRETSTRIVRTIFDVSNAPDAMLVLGEVITHPGKWSSYPPHHHPQPEIYHYRFLPKQGFGFAMLGEDVVKVKNGDSVLILNDVSHPQAAAPGYAMYYIWVIRHIEGNLYKTPVFEPEHLWVSDLKHQKEIWPYEK